MRHPRRSRPATPNCGPDRAGTKKRRPRPARSVRGMELKLSHSFLEVDDQDKALAFYRDVLGLEVRNDVTFEGMRWLTDGPKSPPDRELDIGTDIGPGPLGTTVRRRPLTQGAWVDVRRGWFGGADALFDRLLTGVAWRAERRQMYERVVEVPRLLCFYDEDDRLPHPALDAAREALNAHYAAELGEPLRTAGLCLYRDGRDSVAWHGDTIGRGSTEDTMVAILSIG